MERRFTTNANDEQAFLETKEKYMKINKGSEYLGSSWFYEKLVNPIEKRNNKDAAYFTKDGSAREFD